MPSARVAAMAARANRAEKFELLRVNWTVRKREAGHQRSGEFIFVVKAYALPACAARVEVCMYDSMTRDFVHGSVRKNLRFRLQPRNYFSGSNFSDAEFMQ
jgi:hypothetical protein